MWVNMDRPDPELDRLDLRDAWTPRDWGPVGLIPNCFKQLWWWPGEPRPQRLRQPYRYRRAALAPDELGLRRGPCSEKLVM